MGYGGLFNIKGNVLFCCGILMKGIDIVVYGFIGYMFVFMV